MSIIGGLSPLTHGEGSAMSTAENRKPTESGVSVAERLRQKAPEILRRWEEAVRADIPAAGQQDRPHLLNSMPRFLAELSDALEHAPDAKGQAFIQTPREHGEQRASLEEYSLEEVIKEYQYLRRVIVDVLHDEGSLASRDLAFLHDGIDSAVQIAAACYVQKTHQALAEENRRKDEFLAMLSHELRNPLAPLRNVAELMGRMEITEPGLVRSRDILERQVRHLTRLVDDLLDISRIIHGKVELQKEVVDLGTLIAHAVEQARPFIDSRQQELSVSLPLVPVRLEADPIRLEQVIGNLLHNAAKFTEPRGAIILTAEQEGETAVIRVRDRGVGIRAELLGVIFDLFTQEDVLADRAQGGLGIGLNLVRCLVEMHGGSVTATSPGPGQGSEFVVRLPALAVAREERTEAASHSERQSEPRRVVIVEDNIDAAETLAEFLELSGHEVRTAFEGSAALDTIRDFRPDVVILDIGLPGMTGDELAAAVRRDATLRAVRLVALSGYEAGQIKAASPQTFDRYLLKPVDFAELEQLFNELPERA